MWGKVFARGGEKAAGDPYAVAPQRGKHGVYELRALGDVRVQGLLDAARAGDWAGVKRGLAPFDLGRDHAVLGELADVDGVQDWIVRVIDEDEEKDGRAAALLISGARHVNWGWEARTSALAKDVGQEQWRTFHERLHVGEEHLLQAAELRPDWVTPWRRLLTSARGMSLGPTVSEVRLRAALRREPLDLHVHLEWLSQLQPRWGGEPGQALQFARDALSRTPQGHPLGCVIAMAHIEEWVEVEGSGVLVTDEIRGELRAAAEHSILHPAYVRGPGWQGDFNMFAMALSLAGEQHTVRRVFQELDGAYTRWPWTYFEEPKKQFTRHHRRA